MVQIQTVSPDNLERAKVELINKNLLLVLEKSHKILNALRLDKTFISYDPDNLALKTYKKYEARVAGVPIAQDSNSIWGVRKLKWSALSQDLGSIYGTLREKVRSLARGRGGQIATDMGQLETPLGFREIQGWQSIRNEVERFGPLSLGIPAGSRTGTLQRLACFLGNDSELAPLSLSIADNPEAIWYGVDTTQFNLPKRSPLLDVYDTLFAFKDSIPLMFPDPPMGVISYCIEKGLEIKAENFITYKDGEGMISYGDKEIHRISLRDPNDKSLPSLIFVIEFPELAFYKEDDLEIIPASKPPRAWLEWSK